MHSRETVRLTADLHCPFLSSKFSPAVSSQLPPPHVSSVAYCLLWLLLTLCPQSQGTKLILVEHPAFLSPVDLLSSTHFQAIPICKYQLLVFRSILQQEFLVVTLGRISESFPTRQHTTISEHTKQRQRGQHKPRNKTHT